MEEPFRLLPPKRERKPFVVPLSDKTRQAVLFTGADCLRGQQEMFDGPQPEDTEPQATEGNP